MEEPTSYSRAASRFDELAASIRSLAPKAGNAVVVGIDGCGGSGKTTFASRLAGFIEGAAVIHTDDFASWDDPLGWWPRLLDQVLVPLSENLPARYQRYDWNARRLAEWHTVDPEVLIIEGVSATRKEFRPFLACAIWVECPREVRLARGLERDGMEALPQWEKWMAEEDAYAAAQRPREYASLVVDGDPGIPHSSENEYVRIIASI